MCVRYTAQRTTGRWTMAMFYGMINIAAVNALVIYAHNLRKDQPEKKIKRKDFLLRIAHDLVTSFVTQRYKLPDYLGTSEEQQSCADLSLTTRRYQESEGAVMYVAGVEM